MKDTEVSTAWDRNADQWISDVNAGYDLYRELYTLPAFLSFIPSISAKSVIDLGCGEGTNTRRFAQLGARMKGIDLSSRMIEEARQREASKPLGIDYKLGSYSAMPHFADQEFDIALSTMALMDGPDFASAMKETFRVLKSGGVLCFSILHPCFLTPAIAWVRDSEGRHLGLRVGRYFDRQPYVEHWHFSKRPADDPVEPFAVPRFPRTLSEYVNTVVSAGFRIMELEEPRPDGKAASENPWLDRWHQHAPLVLFVKALKP